MMKKCIILLVIASAISCQHQVDKQRDKKAGLRGGIDSTYLIIPGKQLGYFVINENVMNAENKLKRPDAGDMAMGKALRKWKRVEGKPLSIYSTTKMGVENFSRIKVVRSLSDKFKTLDSLGVGSSLSQLKQSYTLIKNGSFTEDNKTYDLYVSSRGIGFEIDKDSLCNGVVVMEEKTSPQMNYISIYESFEPAE